MEFTLKCDRIYTEPDFIAVRQQLTNPGSSQARAATPTGRNGGIYVRKKEKDRSVHDQRPGIIHHRTPGPEGRTDSLRSKDCQYRYPEQADGHTYGQGGRTA